MKHVFRRRRLHPVQRTALIALAVLPALAQSARALPVPKPVPEPAAATQAAAPAESSKAGAIINGDRHALWIQDRFTGESRLTSIPAEPDMSLWNPVRAGHYRDALSTPLPPPLGILEIDRLGLEVPVFNGADEPQLNRGAGRVLGTGLFYGGGNLALSSHRDGFFRVLKDIAVGDEIRLRGVGGDEVFRVTRLAVVHKSDSDVLSGGADRQLTLVTCHPFYFVGNAPDRFIVHALPVEPDRGS